MRNIIKKIREEKKDYANQMARIQALSKDYRFVFGKLQQYMWSFAGGDGYDMLQTQYDLIDLFEAGAAQGKQVLEVTGEDVAGFCDELMRGNKLWTDGIRNRLNRSMCRKSVGQKRRDQNP